MASALLYSLPPLTSFDFTEAIATVHKTDILKKKSATYALRLCCYNQLIDQLNLSSVSHWRMPSLYLVKTEHTEEIWQEKVWTKMMTTLIELKSLLGLTTVVPKKLSFMGIRSLTVKTSKVVPVEEISNFVTINHHSSNSWKRLSWRSRLSNDWNGSLY